MKPSLSIVVPTFNEADVIDALLQSLRPVSEAGAEIIIADGGSTDDTLARLEPWQGAVKVVSCERGRARQMNFGAQRAAGDWLLFLHADTRLPADFVALWACLSQSKEVAWGFFPVKLSGQQPLLRLVERMMSWRSRWSRIATGDQAIFVRRSLFEQVQGFADVPLMEDIELSKRLRRHSLPAIPNRRVVTSSRRWEQRGVLRTIVEMWVLRAAYACGVSPQRLVRYYYGWDSKLSKSLEPK